MKKLSILIFSMVVCLSSIVAQRQVTGVITDRNNDPLIGANVSVKGSAIGAITDIDGKFELMAPIGTNTLVASYVGFETQEIDISGLSSVTLSLFEGKVLDELVIVGYGEQKRESLTGAVTSVSSSEIELKPLASLDQILQGRVPGLNILSGSGQPGSSLSSVRLRGPSSIQGSTEPIYILDGLQISSDDLQTINTNDLESVTVLKDASSTSVYGASGANGVILMTSKSGEAGKVKVEYNVQYGFTDRTRTKFEVMNSTEKLAFEELAGRGFGWILSRNNPGNMGLTEEEHLANDGMLDSLRSINTDWADEIFRTGVIQTHNLKVSGGDENTKYFISGSYYDEEGQTIGSDFRRGTLRMNLDEKISDKVRIGMKLTGGVSDYNNITTEGLINFNNPFAATYFRNPYEQVFLEDGTYQYGNTGRNPFEEAEFNDRSNRDIKGIAQLNADVELIDNITFSGIWGIDYTGNNLTSFTSPDSRLGSTSSQGGQGALGKIRDDLTLLTLSNRLNYKKILKDDHAVDFLVGQEYRGRWIDSYGVTVFGLTGGLETINGHTSGSSASPAFIPFAQGAQRRKVTLSYLSRANYTYKDRYNLTAGLRRDASSVFGVNNRWGTFWNVGASWLISRESFMSDISAVDFLKIGVSYGTNGNSEGIGEQEKEPLFTIGSYGGGAAFLPSATNPGNSNLKWEVLKGFNLLLDFELFNSFVDGDFNFYNNITEDLFITQEVPRSSGGTSLTINAGSMRNRGYEARLGFNLIRTENTRLRIGAHAAYNNNEITDLGQVEEFEQGTTIIREGLPLGTHYLEEWAGVDPATGNPLYVDDDGNITDDFNAVDPKATFGTFIAPWNGGVNLEFSRGSFSVSALGNWVSGNTLFNNQTFFQENPNFAQFNLLTIMNTIWQEPGDVTEIQRIGTARQFSSKDLEDGSFFRLRDVTVGYEVPLTSKLLGTIRSIRLFVQGKNLWTTTNFTGFDPEDNNNIAQYSYPSSRTYLFGANLGF